MSFEALKTEIQTDPLGRGYAAMTPGQLMASLRASDRARVVAISSAELVAWSGANERGLKIQEAAQSHASRAIQAIAIAANRLLDRDNAQLELGRADRAAMVDALVAGGVLTAADKQALYALGTQAINRLEELGIADALHAGAIEAARS